METINPVEINKFLIIILLISTWNWRMVNSFKPVDSFEKPLAEATRTSSASSKTVSNQAAKSRTEITKKTSETNSTLSGTIFFPLEDAVTENRLAKRPPSSRTNLEKSSEPLILSENMSSIDRYSNLSRTTTDFSSPVTSQPLIKSSTNDNITDSEGRQRRRRKKNPPRKPIRNRNVLDNLRHSATKTLESIFNGNAISSLLEYDPGAPHLPESSEPKAILPPHDTMTQAFQNSRITNLGPHETRDFNSPYIVPNPADIRRPHQYYGGSGYQGGTSASYSYGPGAGPSTGHNHAPGINNGHDAELGYRDYPVYEVEVEEYHPYDNGGGSYGSHDIVHNGGGSYGSHDIVTVTHTRYKNVPVTHYVTDTRTDYITHYKTHFRTKVLEVPVTAYSTQVIPREVPVYTTLFNTKYHTEYHTLTTNYHHTLHYTSTVYRTEVLTNYITQTKHKTYTSVIHTTVYEPVYLTSTFYKSQYITTTHIRDNYITTTSFRPVYVTTTSLERFYETETVVTPHYVTTTFFKELYSTITKPVYITTTEQIYKTVPVYFTTTHVNKHIINTAVKYHHRSDDLQVDHTSEAINKH
ncbi:uncharacterized protein LOC108671454 isoform X3 [Hyalella azteca]|uniref:Uncharacterized protein LOC108671454 isoform X2 n=1 Tax=Hyalella azteca TaxID=294128 RepID=A0A8B7NLE9_HYAAZ|nr:uncharacterized protein LOC108671454 isoform X2 [Hyalella azteca]XP_018014494.1 uncharacterized protein LOC108671454 isoform X3 [Hyalella azteca]